MTRVEGGGNGGDTDLTRREFLVLSQKLLKGFGGVLVPVVLWRIASAFCGMDIHVEGGGPVPTPSERPFRQITPIPEPDYSGMDKNGSKNVAKF